MALLPRFSSKLHVTSPWGGGGINAGVGLSILKELAADADGIFTLASYCGFHQATHFQNYPPFPPVELQLPCSISGTICSLEVSKTKLGNHQLLLLNAKRRLKLLEDTASFDRLFEQ